MTKLCERVETLATMLALLALTTLISHCQAQVDSDFCRETSGSELLPTLPKVNFWANLGVVRDNRLAGDVTLFVDTRIRKESVTLRQGSSSYRIVMDLDNNQIALTDLNRVKQEDSCQVQNSSYDNLHVLAGVREKNGSLLFVPSKKFFTGEGLKIDKERQETVNGLTTERFKSCFFWNSQQITIEATWWFPVEGDRSPVTVKVRGRPAVGGSADFEYFYSVSPLLELQDKFHIERNPFAAPPGVYCPGLTSSNKAVGTFSRFRLSAERKFESPDGVGTELRESYDLRMGVTMLEIVDMKLVIIDDFERGISYIRNRKTDNCTFNKISPISWDAQVESGQIRLRRPDEFYIPNLEGLQYKAKGTYRGYDVESFVGFMEKAVQLSNGSKYDLTAEYFLASRVEFIGGGQAIQRSVPLYLQYKSELSQYNSFMEVFNFDTGVLDTDDHDVSKCFAESQKAHFELLLAVDDLEENNEKYVTDNSDILLYSLTASLSKLLNVSPLRIVRPLVIANKVELIIIELTITEKAQVPGYTPDKPEATMEEAGKQLTAAENLATMRIEVIEGDIVFDVPVIAAVGIDQRSTEEKKTSESGGGGISAGGAVALAFGCLLLGILIGVLALFGVSVVRGQPLLPTPGFGMRRMQEPSA